MNWDRQFTLLVVVFTLIWVAFVLCTGCGRANPGYVNDTTDEVFIPYMEAFGEECAVPYIPIRIGFGLYDETKAGICMAYVTNKMLGGTGTYEEILINKEHWDNYGDEKRKWLIFHEMGHCALGKGHSDNEDDIMYWQLPAVAVITQDKLERLCN